MKPNPVKDEVHYGKNIFFLWKEITNRFNPPVFTVDIGLGAICIGGDFESHRELDCEYRAGYERIPALQDRWNKNTNWFDFTS
jgi:hypothetical protein